MSTALLKQRLREAAEDAVPASLDLWPAIRAQLPAPRPVAHRLTRRGSRRILIAGIALLLVTLTALGTAQAAQAVLQKLGPQFGLVLVGDEPLHPAAGVQTDSPPLPLLTLAQAQAQTPFPIRRPTWLPAGVVFRSARAFGPPSGGEAPNSVLLSYVSPRTAMAGVGLQETQLNPCCRGGAVLPASHTESTTVHGRPAAYAHGGWQQAANDAEVWSGQLDAAILSWDADRVTFVLQSQHLGLGLSDMVRIAESLR